MTTQSSPRRYVVRDEVRDGNVGGGGGGVGGEGGRVNSDFRQHKPVSGLSTEAENEVEAENKVQAENEPQLKFQQLLCTTTLNTPNKNHILSIGPIQPARL